MNNVDFDYYREASVSIFAQGEVLITIQVDGNCVYHWPAIKAHALLWTPYCTCWDICLAKLLEPFAPKDET